MGLKSFCTVILYSALFCCIPLFSALFVHTGISALLCSRRKFQLCSYSNAYTDLLRNFTRCFYGIIETRLWSAHSALHHFSTTLILKGQQTFPSTRSRATSICMRFDKKIFSNREIIHLANYIVFNNEKFNSFDSLRRMKGINILQRIRKRIGISFTYSEMTDAIV